MLWLWTKWYFPPILELIWLERGGDRPVGVLVWELVKNLHSGELHQCCLIQVRFYSNSSLNASHNRGRCFTELLSLGSLPWNPCRLAVTFTLLAFLSVPLADIWGVSVSPPGAGYAGSTVGACADAFWSLWASAYLSKWLSKQTLISGSCSASCSQRGSINFCSGSFWVPSAQPGCQKVQLSNLAGSVWGYSKAKHRGCFSTLSYCSKAAFQEAFSRHRKSWEQK